MACPKNYDWDQFKNTCVPAIMEILDVMETTRHHKVVSHVWSGICVSEDKIGCPYYGEVNAIDIDAITPETIKVGFQEKGFTVEEGSDCCQGYGTVSAKKGEIEYYGNDYHGDSPWFVALGEYYERKKEDGV